MKEAIIPPHIYSRHYYLTDNEGCHEYAKGLNEHVHDKFERALNLADIKPGDYVLDIGCGRGELVYYATMRGANTLGLDYSQAAIEIAHETIKKLPKNLQSQADAKVANVESFNYPNKYNTIFMIEIAEHMHDWQLKDTFKKFNEILSDDGKLIIITPNYLYEKYLQPLKLFFDIPFRMIKWPSRILRKKYKPKNYKEFLRKVFSIKVDRGELNRQMHCNVTTPGRMKRLLKDFEVTAWCDDHSLAPISLLLKKWWGRDIVVIATKKDNRKN